MKTSLTLGLMAFFLTFANILGAQETKPVLIELNFLVSGQPVDTTSNGDVTVELKFDKAMNDSIDPVVKFGLSEPFELTVPEGQGWISSTLWQGFFTVSENNPETGDGKYIFQIYGAKDTTDVEMDTTKSTDLDRYLYICRSGELELTADTLNYDRVNVGSFEDRSVTIVNNSCTELNITNITVPASFSLINSPASFTIPGGGNKLLTIRFSPNNRTDYSETMTFYSDDRIQSTHTVQLIGSAHGSKIALEPNALLSFGKVDVGFSISKTVSITNESANDLSHSDTLHVTNIYTNGSIYTVAPNTLTIPPDSTKSVQVTFTPTEYRVYNGFILSIHSDDLTQTLRTIVLNGDASDETPPARITNLSVSWEGYNGLTNGNNLSICWDNPPDPSEIAEIWWKFVQSPTPPQSAIDTTSAGGRYILNAGEDCASLGLLGRLSSGYWYCYLWLVDGNGNSGYADPYLTSFRYDILPPGKPAILNRSIAEDDWFGSGETFNLTISVPIDPVRGTRDASEVRWRYQTKPAFASNYQGRYVFTTSDNSSVSFTVPFNSTSYCGDDDLYVWLADSTGNASVDSVTMVPYKFDICSKSLTNFSLTWSYFDQFTNSENLQISWEDPNNAGAVSEIWWKFSKTPNAPQSAVDTTNFGGKIVLSSGVNSVSLPLLSKKLSEGFWYGYVWWVFAIGNNTSYSSAFQTSFVYDVTPPGIPKNAKQSIPSTQWFGNHETFKLSIDIPTDLKRGVKDAAEVRWKYQSAPASSNNYNGKYSFINSITEGVEFTVPFNDTSLCGEDSLFYWLADSAGNASKDSVVFVKYRFDNCPPVITRAPDNDDSLYAQLGQDFPDTLLITDDVGVDTVWVRYRFGGAEIEEPAKPVSRIAGTDTFRLVIPDAGVTRRSIEYQIIAIDSFGIRGVGPQDSPFCYTYNDDDQITDDQWYPVRTRVERDFRIDSDGAPVPLIFGEDESNYQLFSVPYDLDSSKVMEVLEDDLGAYDPTMWRLFDYDTENTRFLEGDTARTFIPGRSFFIITRDEKLVDSGPGLTHRTICNDTLRVYEGWNLIATPFNFAIARESLSLANADTNIVKLIHSYEQGWDHVEYMAPWKGYAVYVTKPENQSREIPIYLVVQPKAATGRLSKVTSGYPTLQPGDWLFQISAKAGRMHDFNNWIGIQNKARTGFDNFELAEPPVIGKFVKVSISHPEWNQPAKEFSTDIRPGNADEQVWEFEVQTNQSLTLVNLSFDFLGDFPANMEVHLIDEALKIAQNLRSKSEYSFKSGKRGSKKKLKVIVGSREFVTEQAGEIALLPAKFALLQNYPNPFNPETNIRYNLPEATTVKLVVYDLLGRQVRTLINNKSQNAGYYTVNWNGRNEAGKQVATGVYIYRISTLSQSISRKMILMK